MSLIETARAWAEGDVEPEHISFVLERVEAGDEEALRPYFSHVARFGTAGLRELVGPGPGRMNLAVIRRTTRAVGEELSRSEPGVKQRVVIGYDARVDSRRFAEEAAGVLAAMGIEVRLFGEPVPTPLVAFALRRYAASAAIVVTASHNGKEYNGYKLYAWNGAQIVSPTDDRIAQAIEAGPPANQIAVSVTDARVRPVDAEVVDAYFDAIDALRPAAAPRRDLGIVYTPLHGVGHASVARAFARAGFTALHVVAEEARPNGEFPGLPEPNPEKPSVLERARQNADAHGCDLILANDPDADRLAVAARRPDGSWFHLKGNQIGVLLADYELSRYQGDARPLVVYSIVSSPMVRDVAADYGAHAEATLTGFKWVWNAALDLVGTKGRTLEFVFGFEEALGYCVGDVVRDKDGISAALCFAELAAAEAERGRTVLDRLAWLYRKHGLWVSQQVSVEETGPEGLARLRAAVTRLASTPPAELAGQRVIGTVDYQLGEERRPRWLGKNPMLEWNLEGGARVLVRPSGTEPKLKLYVDARRSLAAFEDVWESEPRANAEALAIGEAARRLFTAG